MLEEGDGALPDVPEESLPHEVAEEGDETLPDVSKTSSPHEQTIVDIETAPDISLEGLVLEGGIDTVEPQESVSEDTAYKERLLERISSDVELDPKWNEVLNSIVDAARSECTGEHLDSIYDNIISVLKDQGEAGGRSDDRRMVTKRRGRGKYPPTRAQLKAHFFARCQDLFNENPHNLAELLVHNDFSLLRKSQPSD